jgi:putative flippase GtrA
MHMQRMNAISRRRQFASFVLIGLVVAAVHFALLIGLVETGVAEPVAATLCGYIVAGALSYRLNRRYAFASKRLHREAVWRFAVVAGVGFAATGLIMAALIALELPYLLAQVLTTGVVLFWSFYANRLWTFGPPTIVP